MPSNAEQGDSQDDSDSEEADSETEETDNGKWLHWSEVNKAEKLTLDRKSVV